MPVERALWQRTFAELPNWPCPTCQSGNVFLDKDTLHVSETEKSKKEHACDDWEPEWIDERFCCLMICQNKRCGEIVSVGGRTIHHSPQANEYGDVLDDGYWYAPGFVYPAPPLFRLPKECPRELADQMKSAFSLFWPSAGSCANSLRVAVEILLDLHEIADTNTNGKGVRVPRRIDERIKDFQNVDDKAAEMLLAVKWIGNVGSHGDLNSLYNEDLFPAFDILEYLIEKLYVKRDEQLQNLAKEINDQKGPLGPLRSRRRRPAIRGS